MSSVLKTIQKMTNNPLNWRIEDIKTVAKYFGIEHRQPGTSHVMFSYKGKVNLTIPAKKPIKPIYIKLFLKMVEQIQSDRKETKNAE